VTKAGKAMTDVELVLDAKADLGEGAIWHARRGLLYWVDINAGFLHVFEPKNGKDDAYRIGEDVGTVVPRVASSERPYESVMLALRRGFAAFRFDAAKAYVVADPERDIPANRFNDGKCDPAGRFWAGTMPEGPGGVPDGGRLYCLYPDLHVEVKETGIRCSNGIAWSLDHRTMYYIDTPSMEIWAYNYDLETGAIWDRRVVVRVPKNEGYPDGMTIDREGMLWVAHWDGWQVVRWNPKTGRKICSVKVPAARVTSCAFGGKNLDELYITTARTGIKAEALRKQPHAGGVFRVLPGVSGLEAFEFAG